MKQTNYFIVHIELYLFISKNDMANIPSDVNQTYYWDSGTSQQQNMEYYPITVPNFPPPNYNMPPNYNTSFPCDNVSTSSVPNVKATHSMYHSVQPQLHQGESTDLQNNFNYQNQTDSQYNQYYNRTDLTQPVNGDYNTNWNMDSKNVCHNNVNNEWQSNNSLTNWTTYQNTSTSWHDTNKTYDGEKLCSTSKHEVSQKSKESECKYDDKEVLHDRIISKKRLRSRESSRSRSDKEYRSRYEDHRNKYRQYSKGRSSSRECMHNGNFERRSSYKRHSYISNSERSYMSNKSKKRSRSQESHSNRAIIPNDSDSVKHKGPTERELLLEKYR